MFNLQGSEIIIILLLALVVLGPEKLPGAIKRAMQTYSELRKLGSGFQSEFKSAIDEPMREMRETADLIKDQADPKRIAEEAERAVEQSAEATAAANRADTEFAEAVERDAGPDLSDDTFHDAFSDAPDDSASDSEADDGSTDASAAAAPPPAQRRSADPPPPPDPFADPFEESA